MILAKQFIFRLTAIIITTVISLSALAQTPNRPRPSFIPEYEFLNYDQSQTGDYLMATFYIAPSSPYNPNLMILDHDGYLKWYMTRNSGNIGNFNYFPSHNKFTFNHLANASSTGRFITLDNNLNLLDSITTVNGIDPDLHENRLLPNGNWLISGKRDSIVDLSAYTFDGTQGSTATTIIAYVIQEFDTGNNLVFQWNSNDYIHPTETYDLAYGYNPNGFDYCHGNAIEKDTDGHYLVSFRHMNAVYKISAIDGHIIWRLGGKSNDFTFTNDPGFTGQHDIRVLPNGNYTVYDNGNMSGPPKKSRALEYQLDTVNWTATRVWEFDYSPSFFARAMGNHQTTANNLHHINYGLNRNTTLNSILVDDSGTILSETHFRDSVYTYRSYYHEQAINLPQFNITCFDSLGVQYLSAPNGFSNYLWSNDALTQDIVVSDTGYYQVYVNYGSGMLASYPFHVTDLNNPCGSNSINQAFDSSNYGEIEAYYDLSGRLVDDLQSHQIYIVRYRSGLTRKIFFVEE